MTTARTITVFLAGTLLLAGCTNDPGPAPTITDPPGTTTKTPAKPEPDPARAAEQDAIQTLKDFNTASDQLGKSGYDDLSPISGFLAGDYQRTYLDELGWLRSQGAVQVGDTTMTNYRVVDHHAVEDPFYDDQLTIEACSDTTDADIVLPNGSSVVLPGRRGRFVATVTMWHKLYENMWSIVGWITEGGRPC